MDKQEVYRPINTLGEDPERWGAIKTKLPRIELLRLWRCEWETERLHSQVFLYVTLTFGSAIKLKLFYVAFRSVVVFGRLMRALPRLSSLAFHRVQFKRGYHVAGAVRMPGSRRLDAADLRYSDDISDFFVSIGAHLRHLTCYRRDFEKHSELLTVSAESLLFLKIYLRIDLTPAVNLRILSVNGNLDDIAKAVSVLLRMSVPKLVEVTVGSWLLYVKTPVSVQDILNTVYDDCFVQMDHTLSGKQFPALGKITFLLRYVGRRSVSEVMDVIFESSWGTLLASNLPALHASGGVL
ncbi:uncharacterized protein FIBRA_08974 [Fibroporia radiculosa]|uniref:Uncharacterized protein n=1 Tax=Fibroporia radiculosa TaxID=599839 RepID=J4I3L8_9APHY|nr:uncharacterized protein FIBRA_08974 [Fibroporia radiculosa]CCM06687.1 predicted protein [Fibroporia radiculosa]